MLIKRFAMPIAAFAFMAVAGARADVVQYTAVGTFSAGGTDVAVNTAASDTLTTTPQVTVLTFTPGQFSNPPEATTFTDVAGIFSYNSALLGTGTVSLDSGDTFTETITQAIPGIASDFSTAKVVGSITYGPPLAGGTETLNVTFNSNNPIVLTSGGISNSYFIHPVTINLNASGSPISGSAALDITVSELPLPATASTGLALFAGLGALVGIRKLAGRRSIA